jgi:hypothetical protein
MVVISTRELFQHPSKYFGMLPKNRVIIKRNKSFIELTYRGDNIPEQRDDFSISRDEMENIVSQGLSDYESGNYTTLTPELQKEMLGL